MLRTWKRIFHQHIRNHKWIPDHSTKLHEDKFLQNLDEVFEKNFQNRSFNRFKTLTPQLNELYLLEENSEQLKRLVNEAEEMDDDEFRMICVNDLNVEMDKFDSKRKKFYSDFQIYIIQQNEKDFDKIEMEIRSGIGGQEAALFATELFEMYKHLLIHLNCYYEIVRLDRTDLKGIKFCSLIIHSSTQQSINRLLTNESGIHRVQRIPLTEKGGRMHTSTATVAILPHWNQNYLDEFLLNENELKFDVYKSSGAGGQHVNKTNTAVRVTHKPTGVVVERQCERSQVLNRRDAINALKIRLINIQFEKEESERKSQRKTQIAESMRSDKIRTYNYQQDRIVDHRIGSKFGTFSPLHQLLIDSTLIFNMLNSVRLKFDDEYLYQHLLEYK